MWRLDGIPATRAVTVRLREVRLRDRKEAERRCHTSRYEGGSMRARAMIYLDDMGKVFVGMAGYAIVLIGIGSFTCCLATYLALFSSGRG